jgi:hypothetical protein
VIRAAVLAGVLVWCGIAASCTADDVRPAGPAVTDPSDQVTVPDPFVAPPPVAQPPRPVRTDIGRLPLTTIDVDLDKLPVGPPTLLPWAEFAGNPEEGRELFLHVGTRRVPITRGGYLRQVVVWRTDVVWSGGGPFHVADSEGSVTTIRGVPVYRTVFGPDVAYFVRDQVLHSWSSGDGAPAPEMEVAELAGSGPAAPIIRSSVAGILGRDDPVIRITRLMDGATRVTHLYSPGRGAIPLPAWWQLTPGPTQVGFDRAGRVWSGYDSRTYLPLWSRIYTDGRRTLAPSLIERLSPRLLLVAVRDLGREAVVIEARTGAILRRLLLPTWDVHSEDPGHFVYEEYDGPPNPLFDPRDAFPEPSELTWPNVLVRCSFHGRCERAARVQPVERSLMLGDT